MNEWATPDPATRTSYPFYSTSASEIAMCDYKETLAAVAAFGGCGLVLTSPPYDDARTYGNDVSWRFEDYQALGDSIFAALKPGGHALMVLDGPVRDWRKGKGTERSFTPWRVMLDWAERVGFRVPDRLAYGRQGHPGEYLGRFRNDWEPLLWFQRPGGDGYFDKWPLATQAKKDATANITTGREKDGSMRVRRQSGRATEERLMHRGTLWSYGPVGNGHDGEDSAAAQATNHPARFSVRFAEDAVRCFCAPGGLVVDPFVGSGTVAVASVRHGRRFGGGDLYGDEDGKPWALHAHERVQAEMSHAANTQEAASSLGGSEPSAGQNTGSTPSS